MTNLACYSIRMKLFERILLDMIKHNESEVGNEM